MRLSGGIRVNLVQAGRRWRWSISCGDEPIAYGTARTQVEGRNKAHDAKIKYAEAVEAAGAAPILCRGRTTINS